MMTLNITRPTPNRRLAGNSPTQLKPAIYLAVAAIVLATIIALDFTSPADFLTLEVMKRAAWCLGLIAVVILALATDREDHRLLDGPAPLMHATCIAGLAAIVMHAVLDVVLFEGALLAVFILLAGSTVGIANIPAKGSTSRRWLRSVITFGVLATLVVGAFAIVVPLTRAELAAQAGDDAVREGNPSRAVERFRDAFDLSPVKNADFLERAAEAALFDGDVDTATVMLERASQVNPRRIKPRAQMAGLLMSQGHAEAAIPWAASAVELNPHEMSLRIRYAEALAAAGRSREAAEQLEAALSVNAALASDEMERLSDAEIAAIEMRIDALRG